MGLRSLASDSAWVARRRALSVGLVALAALVRVGYWFEYRATPYADHPIVDARAYDERAWGIAQGDWIGDAIFYQDPFYPYALAILYSIAGRSYALVHALQALLGVLLCLLVVELGRRVFDGGPHREKIGWLAGTLCALCTPLVFYEGFLLKTSLGLFLGVAHLVALLGLGKRGASGAARPAAALATGALLGLSLLNRGNYALLAPLFAAWLALRAIGPRDARNARRALTVVGTYAAGALLVVLPITVRNRVVGGEWVLVTSQGGQNFYIGNNPHNLYGSYTPGPDIRPNPLFEERDFRARAERETGRPMRATEVSSHYFGEGLRWIRERPGDAARLFGRKCLLWITGTELADNYSFGFLRAEFSRVLRLPFATGTTLGLIGWSALAIALLWPRRAAGWLSARASPGVALAALFLLAYSLSIVAFFVYGRYRVPIYPVLAVLGAGGAVWAFSAWRDLGLAARTALCATPLVVGAAVGWQTFFPALGHWSIDDRATEVFNVASIHAERGEVEPAREWLEHLLEEPRVMPDVLVAAGREATRIGDDALSERALERATRDFPDSTEAWLALARVRLRLGGRVPGVRAAYRTWLERVGQAAEGAALAEAAQVLLASPEPADLAAGLSALRRLPLEDPADPPWLDSLLRLRVEGRRVPVLREFLDSLLAQDTLGEDARASVRARLDGLGGGR